MNAKTNDAVLQGCSMSLEMYGFRKDYAMELLEHSYMTCVLVTI